MERTHYSSPTPAVITEVETALRAKALDALDAHPSPSTLGKVLQQVGVGLLALDTIERALR